MRYGFLTLFSIVILAGCAPRPATPAIAAEEVTPMSTGEKVAKSEEEWKKELSPEQYQVLREKGTERPFTGKYWDSKERGTYSCAGCGQELFESDTKFESFCGWPSFWDAIDKTKVAYHEDNSLGMRRVEVTCSRCGGHLGHIFDDGPRPTGKRFCINSASLTFKPAEAGSSPKP